MSQIPQVAAEPQVPAVGTQVTPAPVAQPGTGAVDPNQVPALPQAVPDAAPQAVPQPQPPAVPEQPPVQPVAPETDWQAEATKFKAEADRLKGFQAVYTRAKQAGVWDGVESMLEGTNPEGAQAKWQRQQQAIQVLDEVEKMGGWERVRGDFQLLNDTAGPTEPAAPQAQQPVGEGEWVRKDEVEAAIDTRVEKKVADTFAAIDRAGTKQDVAETIATQYGYATDGNPANPAVLAMIQGALDADLGQVTSGLRDPEPEEIRLAGQRVAQTLFAPLRAGGAQPTVPLPESPAVPPGMNARVPSGAQPAKPVEQYTSEEQRAAAKAMARDMLQPMVDAMPQVPDLPTDHKWE